MSRRQITNQDKTFLTGLGLSLLLLSGVIVDNIYTALRPPKISARLDVEKIKKKIQEAGLTPHEARYWKEGPY